MSNLADELELMASDWQLFSVKHRMDVCRRAAEALRSGEYRVRHAFNSGYARGAADGPIGLGEVAERIGRAWLTYAAEEPNRREEKP